MTGFFTNSAQAKIFEDDWVQGLVVDQNGEAVIGASIFEKGTQKWNGNGCGWKVQIRCTEL